MKAVYVYTKKQSDTAYIFLPAVLLQKIKEIMESVTIPVMAKCRIGHFAEAQILEALGVDFIDESEGKKRN